MNAQRTMADWHEHFRLHREMTAADLGLPLMQWTVQWLLDHYIWQQPLSKSGADSFWLGADHA
jgi:hypothetical protein